MSNLRPADPATARALIEFWRLNIEPPLPRPSFAPPLIPPPPGVVEKTCERCGAPFVKSYRDPSTAVMAKDALKFCEACIRR